MKNVINILASLSLLLSCAGVYLFYELLFAESYLLENFRSTYVYSRVLLTLGVLVAYIAIGLLVRRWKFGIIISVAALCLLSWEFIFVFASAAFVLVYIIHQAAAKTAAFYIIYISILISLLPLMFLSLVDMSIESRKVAENLSQTNTLLECGGKQ